VSDALPAATEFHARSMRELGGVLAFVDETCAGVDADTVFAIRLAVEEAFTNIYKHGYAGGEGPVAVHVAVAPRQVVATLVDEAPVFDPADAPAPDLDAAWDERRTGGLGCHLLRQMMDEVKYARRSERGNVLTLVKTRS
jgi:anti-sigma regulatory factor (Ser/Thr protein kinase)